MYAYEKEKPRDTYKPFAQQPELLVCMVGPPGAGKSTLARRYAQEHGFYHFSLGDHLRKLVRRYKEGKVGAEGQVDEGESFLVDEDVRRIDRSYLMRTYDLMQIIRTKVDQVMRGEYVSDDGKEIVKGTPQTKILIDGFPRSVEQAWYFLEWTRTNFVVALSCPRDIAADRFVARKQPDRPAEDIAKFMERMNDYEENVKGVFRFCRDTDIKVLTKVDASNDIEQNYENLVDVVKNVDNLDGGLTISFEGFSAN
ncbi:cytidine monophosphate (UMP-CMP) kinase 1, cytosolic [Ascosphaera atra]|nr:cytidine monophosphate (UMP-CMP) kinase 1, cytosolic [Ascosphaera atra]